jgi:hypothetical protein
MIILITMVLYNEIKYLDEWINFHKKKGINFIYIYIVYKTSIDKNINKKYNSLINKYNNIIINHKKFSHMIHIKSFFNDYYDNHKNDWISVLDIDEFLYSPNKKLHELIKYYEDNNKYAIAVNWKCFGSNNIVDNPKYKVLDIYTKCARKYHGINQIIKSLVKINVLNLQVINDWNTHKFILKKGYNYYTSTGIEFIENNINNLKSFQEERISYLKELNLNISCRNDFVYTYPEENPNLIINHYITRSKNEYIDIKIKNNNQREDRYNLKYFDRLNFFLNEEENKDIITI